MRIVFAAGGTGGHFIPAMSVAKEIKRANDRAEIVFMGTGKHFELEACRKEGFEHMTITSRPVRRSSVTSNLLLPVMVVRGIVTAMQRMTEKKPDVLVSMGGYPSVPPFFAGVLLRIPRLVHEQNSMPGLASRVEAFFADQVCLSYDVSRSAIRGGAEVVVTGNPATPSREQVMAAREKKRGGPVLLVMGGSQGAHTLNEVVLRYLRETGAAGWKQVYFQTGLADHTRVERALASLATVVTVMPFFHDMESIYPTVDVAVTRAGATTITELSGWGIPSVLVPYPFATGGHQKRNARMMEEAGAAVMIEETLFNHRRLARVLEGLLADTGRMRGMASAASGLARHEAARDIAVTVLNVAAAHSGRGV